MALLGKIELTESTQMEFGLEIFGTTEQTQNVRLVIEGKEFDVACRCEVTNGEIIAHIPKLKGIMESGVYDVRLEVLVGDRHFVPLKEQIELNPLVEFDVKTKKVEPIKEGVKISVKKPVVSEDTRESKVSGLEQNIKKAIKEGYEVSQVGDNYIMKKGDSYVGIISEAKILKSKKAYSSLTELIDGLSK